MATRVPVRKLPNKSIPSFLAYLKNEKIEGDRLGDYSAAFKH